MEEAISSVWLRRIRMAFSVPLMCIPCVLAAEDSDAPSSSEVAETSAEVAELPLKKAENIDLKEVVNVLLQPNEQAEAEEKPPTSESYSVDEKALVGQEAEHSSGDDVPAAPEPGLLKKLANELVGEPSVEKTPLVLLNSEVQAGTSTRLGWSPSVSFMGISAPTAVLVVNGAKPGPVLCITAAVHGDELNGIEIVRRVLYDVDPSQLSGALIGVPIVNLQGFRRSSRYLTDRRDLNRFFPGNPEGSSAARIAHSFFSEVITHCNLLIDLHTGSFRRTNLPQIRADLGYEKVANLAKKMGAIVVVQSGGAEGSLRRAAVENGIPAVTLEAGAPHELQKTSVDHGVKSIESAMDSLGMTNRRRFWERPDEPVYYKSAWVRAKEGGILFSDVALGASVKQGDLLGKITDPITNMRTDIVAPFDGRVIGMALNQVMFPGFAAYHLGLKASAQTEATVSDSESAENGNPATIAENEELAPPEASADADIQPETPVSEGEAAPKALPTEDSE